MPTQSWKSVARELAHRMSHQAYADHNPLDPDCPRCDDVRAYRSYVERERVDGVKVRDPLPEAREYTLQELLERHNSQGKPK